MEIKKFEKFLDGGTIKITTDEGIFCFDHRIRTTTDGRLYDGMPKDDNSNLIENSDELEGRIIESLKFFRDDFYQSSIEHLINSKQK
jgi:hypothetical protein